MFNTKKRDMPDGLNIPVESEPISQRGFQRGFPRGGGIP